MAPKKKQQTAKEVEVANAKRRNRVPISCTICRRRKVKCDKRRPVCTGCEKTGVAHLCHYIDPPWAQPLSNDEINPGTAPVEGGDQSELVEKLKEKIKMLENKLMKDGSVSSPNTSINDDDFNEKQDNTEDPNESLNLGKKFDMLHVKTTTTVHLGATSWLAIMKGDPYLRVLWAHIFKLRKQAEELKFKKKVPPVAPQLVNPPNSLPKASMGIQVKPCDDNGSPASSTNEIPTIAKCPVSGKDLSQGKCPVIHSAGKCPVVHQSSPQPSSLRREPTDIDAPTCPVSGRSQAIGKCPVSHLTSETPDVNTRKRSREEIAKAEEEQDQEQDTPQVPAEDEKVCPLMIGDNSFLNKLRPGAATDTDNNKRKKTSRSNSNERANGKNVKPDDFKKNPVGMMQKFLPKKKILWMLLDRFFEVLYVYMPFVDEESFKEEVKAIFGDRDDTEQEVKIKIRSGVDFALVGTVCIILRLTWCTLPMNNLNKLLKKSTMTKNYQEDLEILKTLQKPENEVHIELVDCVKHCFSNLKLMRRSSLIIVQCALYMRLYFIYSPEDGDGADGGESQIFLGMIVQMAISIGLHRDPQNFENFSNERQRHLWRKIWYELVSLDIEQSMNLGCPRCLQNFEEFSDTELPGQVGDGLDLQVFKHDKRELTVIKNINMRSNIDKLLSKTMRVLLNVNQPAKKHNIDQLIIDLQRSIDGFGVTNDQYALPQLGKILVNRSKAESLASSATRGLEFRQHVLVNMLIYLLNYIMFVHFEPKSSQDPQSALLARKYAQKALDCALQGYRNCTLFFDCGLEYFGPGVDLVLTPLLLLVGHRSIQFMVSLILRSRCGPYMKPTSAKDGKPTPMKSFSGAVNIENGFLNSENNDIADFKGEYTSIFNVDVNSGELLATILLEHMDKFHTLSESLGQKYQYSWRMSKAVGFFITLLKKPINSVKNIVKTEREKTPAVSSVLISMPLSVSQTEERSVPLSRSATLNDSNTSQTQPVSHFGSVLSPFTEQPQDAGTPMYSNDQYSMSAPTPENGIGQFSLSFTADTNTNPINALEVDVQEQFPEIMNATEGFVNFDSDKSFGDFFGMGQPGSSGPVSSGPVSSVTHSGFPDIPGFFNGSTNEQADHGVTNDYSAMMTGSWFN